MKDQPITFELQIYSDMLDTLGWKICAANKHEAEYILKAFALIKKAYEKIEHDYVDENLRILVAKIRNENDPTKIMEIAHEMNKLRFKNW